MKPVDEAPIGLRKLGTFEMNAMQKNTHWKSFKPCTWLFYQYSNKQLHGLFQIKHHHQGVLICKRRDLYA